MTDINTKALVPLATNDAPADSGSTLLCSSQDKIEIVFDDQGNASITQTCWPDEDQTITVSRDNIEHFIDRLTDALGIPSIGGGDR